jgi:hypothetical protein
VDDEVAEPLALDLDDWDAWRPTEPAQRLAGVGAPSYVAGGWPLDLFLGEQRLETLATWSYAGAGTTPSCCIMASASNTPQCS